MKSGNNPYCRKTLISILSAVTLLLSPSVTTGAEIKPEKTSTHQPGVSDVLEDVGPTVLPIIIAPVVTHAFRAAVSLWEHVLKPLKSVFDLTALLSHGCRHIFRWVSARAKRMSSPSGALGLKRNAKCSETSQKRKSRTRSRDLASGGDHL